MLKNTSSLDVTIKIILRDMLSDKNTGIRQIAAQKLGEFKVNDKNTLEALRVCINDYYSNSNVRIAVAKTLGILQVKDDKTLQALQKCFNNWNNNSNVRVEVANALASYFIDENLKVREAQAVSTSAFLNDELKSVRIDLKETERKLMEFRKINMGTLPEQLVSNLRTLERLHSELNNNENRLMALQEVLLRQETQSYRPHQPSNPESALHGGVARIQNLLSPDS